jgi:hypothetical protein
MKKKSFSDMVVYIYNPSTWEAEADRCQIKASLGYIK